jgi:hypothetical protein
VKYDQDLDFRDQPDVTIGQSDARVIVDFAVGSAGVGPAVGFGSDDFFPVAPQPDAVIHARAAGGDVDGT